MIFISIKRKWLLFKVYKYTLKYKDALSKSDCYSKTATSFHSMVLHYERIEHFNDKFHKAVQNYRKYKMKSEHFKNTSDIYLSKKLDAEEELQYLNYKKV